GLSNDGSDAGRDEPHVLQSPAAVEYRTLLPLTRALQCLDAAPARSGACRHFSSLRGISAATACEIGAGEAPPGKIKHFSSVNPARGKALRPRLGHLFRKRGEL